MGGQIWPEMVLKRNIQNKCSKMLAIILVCGYNGITRGKALVIFVQRHSQAMGGLCLKMDLRHTPGNGRRGYYGQYEEKAGCGGI